MMLTETKGWLEGDVIFGQPYILASLGIATGLSTIELSPIILLRNLSPRLSVERPQKWIYAVHGRSVVAVVWRSKIWPTDSHAGTSRSQITRLTHLIN